MYPFNSERFIAFLFCVSAVSAFAVSQPVAHAAVVFPPAHLAPRAAFAPAMVAPDPNTPRRGPWYRPGTAGEARSAGPRPDGTAASWSAPWYLDHGR